MSFHLISALFATLLILQSATIIWIGYELFKAKWDAHYWQFWYWHMLDKLHEDNGKPPFDCDCPKCKPVTEFKEEPVKQVRDEDTIIIPPGIVPSLPNPHRESS